MHKEFNDKILTDYSICKTTLKETSYDKERKIYLTNIAVNNVINFDGLTTKVYNKLSLAKPCSNDALLLTDNYNYFIEFKNQPVENIKDEILINKNISSITTLLAEKLTDLKTLKNNYIYLIVCNNTNKNSKSQLNSMLAKETPAPLKLNYFETHYFAKVKAFIDPKEFETYYENNMLKGNP